MTSAATKGGSTAPPAPITLVLADDHPLMLSGLEGLLALEQDLRVLARCASGEAALEAVRQHRPDCLVLDLCMPGKDGLAVLRELHAEGLPTRVVLFTAALDEDEVLEAIHLGVKGVVLKDMAPQLLVHCIRKVHAGGEWLERRSVGRALEKIVRRAAEAQQQARLLTPAEIKVVRLAALGLRNKEISKRLSIGEGTVKLHLHHIYDKLKVEGRMALTLYAKHRGLI